jgi:hypothetical protein
LRGAGQFHAPHHAREGGAPVAIPALFPYHLRKERGGNMSTEQNPSQHGPSRRSALALGLLGSAGAGFLTACASAAGAGDEKPAAPACAPGEKPLAVSDMTGKKLRVVRPNDMVTMEFDMDRITILVDAQQRIQSVRIG